MWTGNVTGIIEGGDLYGLKKASWRGGWFLRIQLEEERRHWTKEELLNQSQPKLCEPICALGLSLWERVGLWLCLLCGSFPPVWSQCPATAWWGLLHCFLVSCLLWLVAVSWIPAFLVAGGEKVDSGKRREWREMGGMEGGETGGGIFYKRRIYLEEKKRKNSAKAAKWEADQNQKETALPQQKIHIGSPKICWK